MAPSESELVRLVRHAGDDWLAALIGRRPDLARPVPPSLTALAARAATRGSAGRAIAHLPVPDLVALEAVAVLTAGRGHVAVAALSAATGFDTSDAVERLRADALLLGEDEVALAPGVAEAIGAAPLGLGPSLRALGARQDDGWPTTPTALQGVLAEAPEGARTLLQALTWGPAVGTLGTDLPPAARWLLDRHVLHRLSSTEVVLPREVALAARGATLVRQTPTSPPIPEAQTRTAATVAAEVVAASEQVLRHVQILLETWTEDPPTVLRSGGVAARDIKQLATALGATTGHAALVVELAGMLELLGHVQHEDGTTWAPTARAGLWSESPPQHRWAELVTTWSTSARVPWLAGTRTEKGVLRSALAPELTRTWAQPLRQRTLAAIAAWPDGAAPHAEQVRAHLAWWTPRSVPPVAAVAAVLAEADTIGMLGAGALAPPARLLTGLAAPEEIAAAWHALQPEPVADLVIQGDLTGVVPGRPTPELAALLDASADVEGRGAALTVRFSAASIGRALTHGWSASDLLNRLRAVSVSGVPQPLEYLVHDAARRNRQVRVQPAAAVLRLDDEETALALLGDPRLAHLGLRRVGPTTLAADASAMSVHEAVRGTGAAPVLEGADGLPVPLPRSRTTAVRPVVLGTPPTERPVATTEAIAAMRAGEERASALLAGVADDGSAELELLRAAADRGALVRIVVAGSGGATQERVVRPISVDGGRVRSLDASREAEITVAIHRIVAVHPV